MKRYFVEHYRDFANTYNLYYAESQEQEREAISKGYERIPRRVAERMCREEREREQYSPMNAGYASTVILPIWYPTNRDWRTDSGMVQEGCLIVKAR